jgi:hypothetical protein
LGGERAPDVVNHTPASRLSRNENPQEFHEAAHAYRLPLIERDWLDDADAAALRELLGLCWSVAERYPTGPPARFTAPSSRCGLANADLAMPPSRVGRAAIRPAGR